MTHLKSSLILALLLVTGGCGAGPTVALSSGGGGGGAGPPTKVANVSVSSTRESPAVISFDLLGSQRASVRIEVSFPTSAGLEDVAPFLVATEAGDETGLTKLAAGGTTHVRKWDFASQVPMGANFEEGYTLFVSLASAPEGSEKLGAPLSLGNDAPVIQAVEVPASEQSGTVGIQITMSDSSSDVVDLHIEYADGAGGWLPARPALLDLALPTPSVSLGGVVAAEGGSDVSFFWDSEYDLSAWNGPVEIRASASDGVVTGAYLEGAVVTLRNNDLPTVGEPSVIASDGRRGIAVQVPVADTDSPPEALDVVLQWEREGSFTPFLPGDRASVEAILADPAQREVYRIADLWPTYVGGRVVAVDATTVRLPELASSARQALARDLVGRKLQLMRDGVQSVELQAPEPGATPVAALPVDEGAAAVVLWSVGSGWEVDRHDLAQGLLEATLASGASSGPMAMTWAERGSSVLVACGGGTGWSFQRATLDGADPEILAGGSEDLTVRAIARLGSAAAAFTTETSLVLCTYPGGYAPSVGSIPMDDPWGVVVDPLDQRRLYVAEGGGGGVGRVVTFDLDTHEHMPVVTRIGDERVDGVPAPRGIALASPNTLLVVNAPESEGGPASLRAVPMGARGRNQVHTLAEVGAGALNVAATDGVWAVLDPEAGALVVKGGVAQARTVGSWDSMTQTLTADTPFAPEPAPSQSWRIDVSEGAGMVVVDARGIEPGVSAGLRATVVDEASASFQFGSIEVTRTMPWAEPTLLANALSEASDEYDFAIEDMDGDGDLDVAILGHSVPGVFIFYQEDPGQFSEIPTYIESSDQYADPWILLVGDLNGDDRLDLLWSSILGDLKIQFALQGADAGFSTPYWSPVDVPTMRRGVKSLGDFNGDGHTDLLIAGGADWPYDGLSIMENAGSIFPFIGFNPSTALLPWPNSYSGDTETVDLELDGDLDIVSALNGLIDDLVVFRQVSSGTFAQQEYFVDGWRSRKLAIHDLNDDGLVDIAGIAGPTFAAAVYFQTVDGEFDPRPLLLESIGGPTKFSIADFDGNGLADVAEYIAGTASIDIFFQTAPGKFAPGGPNVFLGADLYLTSDGEDLIPRDLDGDGRLELCFLSNDPGSPGRQVSVLRATRLGSLGLPSVIGPGGGSFLPVDHDADGDLDAILVRDRELLILAQTSAGVFEESVLFSLPPTSDPIGASAAADLDGAGGNSLEIVFGEGSALWILGATETGSLEMLASVATDVDGPIAAVVVHDVSGDGTLDLVVAGSDALQVFSQTSDHAFLPSAPILFEASTAHDVRDLVATDVDADGHADLLLADAATGQVLVLLQHGAGSFSPTTLKGAVAPTALVVDDLDGDGDQDILALDQAAEQLVLWRQDGPATFVLDPEVPIGGPGFLSDPRALAAGDLDADGDLDLVVANANDVRVLRQVRPGVFEPDEELVGGAGTTDDLQSIEFVDVDGDGDPDVLTSGAAGLVVFYNSH